MSTTANTQEVLDKCQRFLRQEYSDDIGLLAQHYPSERRSLEVDWMELFRFDPDFAEDLLENPDLVGDYFDEALRTYDLPIDIELDKATVRFSNTHTEPLDIPQTRARHINQYITVNGQVAKTSAIDPRLEEAAFECQRCGTLTYIPQGGDGLQEPHECQGCERQGPYSIDYDQSSFIDAQKLRVQEPPERTKGGDGDHIDVDLEDDLVGAVNPGDRVDISGVFRVATRSDDDSRTMKPYMEGEAVEIEESDYENIEVEEHLDRIREIVNSDDPLELLIESLAPKVKGHDDVKKAIVLQMFGGWQHEYEDGTIDRGDSHILLVGDPGSAKSTLLRAVEDLAPRSVYASGKGMSAAGATAAAVRDDFGSSEWGLEAGALVKANKGVACIDELDKVDEDAVSSLHDALESQRVSVNKAGINTTLPAETALLAAGNPTYGRFDRYESIPEQIDLGPTLISRFDLIFIVTDDPEEDRDREIAEHVIATRREGVETPIDREVFRAYVAHAKQSVHPVIEDPDVEQRLIDFFVSLRTSGDDDAVPVTFRKLEAIQRLAEASARVRLSETIELKDVKRATSLVQKTMRQVGRDPETGEYDADVIETGQSKSQRTRVKNIQQLVAELQNDYDSGVPREELINEAEELGIDPSKAEHEIQKMKEQGRVYEPRDGHLRIP